MSYQTNDFILRLKHYFCCLGAALAGRDLYLEKCEELSSRIEHAYSDIRNLQEMYASALEKWKQAQVINKQMQERNRKTIMSYQTLVETLRSTIRDKEKEIADMNREFGIQLDKAFDRKVDEKERK